MSGLSSILPGYMVEFQLVGENSLRKAFSSKSIAAFLEAAKIKVGKVPLHSFFPSRKLDFVPSLTNPCNLCNPTNSHFSFSSPVVFSTLC